MKIGILTQTLGYNYGCNLQNWALQQVLSKMGHQPITLIKRTKINWLRAICVYLIKHFIFHTRRSYSRLPWDKSPHTNTISFVRKHINRDYIGVVDESKLANMHCDAVIVGSDQVWRPLYNKDVLDTMYCSFLSKQSKITAIAYAASFGVDSWEYTDEQSRMAKTEIQKFKAVSVREAKGVELCSKYLSRDAVHVLDPTMLLDAKEYLPLTNGEIVASLPKEYIGVFILDLTPEKKVFVDNMCSCLGKEAFYFGNTQYDGKNLMPVEKWLAVIINSSFMITDSFHGTVFSIIFHRPFVSLVNYKRGSERFTSLLNTLQLSDRMVDLNEIKSACGIFTKQIDWGMVDKLWQKEREVSLDFLRANL